MRQTDCEVSSQVLKNQAVQPQKMATGLIFGFSKKKDCTIYVAKTKALISCAFVFAYAKNRFSHTWLP